MTLARTLLVIGGTGGIGSALARRLHPAGWSIALVGRSPERSAAVRGVLAAAGIPVAVHCADIRDAHAIWEVAETLRNEWGWIDAVLINALGESLPERHLHNWPLDEFMHDVCRFTSGFFNSLAAVLPGMVARRQGRVLVTFANHALTPIVGRSGRLACMAVVDACLRSLALDCPGVTGCAVKLGRKRAPGGWRWHTGEEVAAEIERALTSTRYDWIVGDTYGE